MKRDPDQRELIEVQDYRVTDDGDGRPKREPILAVGWWRTIGAVAFGLAVAAAVRACDVAVFGPPS